jgi:hypothetical protein
MIVKKPLLYLGIGMLVAFVAYGSYAIPNAIQEEINEQKKYDTKFLEVYAFQPMYRVMEVGTDMIKNDFIDDVEIEFNWFVDGEYIDPEYWYSNCIENCSGTNDEIVWQTDHARPITVVPSHYDIVEFTMTPKTDHIIDHKEFQKINGNIDWSKQVPSKDITVYFMNLTHTRDFYHGADGNILPIMTFFVPVTEKQTYQGSLTIDPICHPLELETIIVKENCDIEVKFMQISKLLKFISDNPDALTDDEQDILISKAMGNIWTKEIDLEVENQAMEIMWRLIEDGLYK